MKFSTQFSLRKLCVLFTVFSICLGVGGRWAKEARDQATCVRSIERMGGQVSYESGEHPSADVLRILFWRLFDPVVLVDFRECPEVKDIACLCKLPHLQWVYLDGTSVDDLSPLSGMSDLWWVSLSRTPIRDITPLESVPSLDTLVLSDTDFSDYSFLKALPIRQLIMRGTKIDDLTLLPLETLETLHIQKTHVRDFSPLVRAQQLKKLSLDHVSRPIRDNLPVSSRLEILDISDVIISREELADLQEGLSGCRIYHNFRFLDDPENSN